MDQLKELLQSVDSAKEAVNKLKQRRRALHNAFVQRVSGAIQSAIDLIWDLELTEWNQTLQKWMMSQM